MMNKTAKKYRDQLIEADELNQQLRHKLDMIEMINTIPLSEIMNYCVAHADEVDGG